MEQATMQTREILVHRLYEAAELEHDLMCTYLYAAFSLRDGEGEGLSAQEASAVARWRRQIIRVAVEEMGHLTAVWNITAALGGAPRFGRDNFPLIDPQLDGPLRVHGNMEIISGTGRVVTRVTNALLCRCGGSANKPFCDGTHARIGFKSL